MMTEQPEFTVAWARRVLAEAQLGPDKVIQSIKHLRDQAGTRPSDVSPTGVVPLLGLREAKDLFEAAMDDGSTVLYRIAAAAAHLRHLAGELDRTPATRLPVVDHERAALSAAALDAAQRVEDRIERLYATEAKVSRAEAQR